MLILIKVVNVLIDLKSILSAGQKEKRIVKNLQLKILVNDAEVISNPLSR